MTNTTINARIARYFTLPMISAGIIGAAAVGMAGMANATTLNNDPGFHSPAIKAHPAPEATPGWRNHHGQFHIQNLIDNGYRR
jgi:hypothetical protein